MALNGLRKLTTDVQFDNCDTLIIFDEQKDNDSNESMMMLKEHLFSAENKVYSVI